jgi:hypothetical protein
MCGRQMTVTLCFFIIARVTTIQVEEGEPNIFGVSAAMQNFFNTGFLGAIITTILGSISWQFVAAAFPIAFLSNPIVYIFLQLALALEATGICAAAWFLALIQKWVMKFQFDEVYVGTPEERASKEHPDNTHANDHLDMGTNILTPSVGLGLADWTEGSYTDRRERILKNITDLREQLKLAETKDEQDAFRTAIKLEVTNMTRVNKEQEESTRHLDPLEEE